MRKISELKEGDILYALNKHILSKIIEFNIVKIDNEHLILDTKDGLRKLKITDDYVSNFSYICVDRLREIYYVGTDKKYLVESYKKWLHDSVNFYQRNITELKYQIKKIENDLQHTIEDIEKISKLKYD